MPIDSPYSPLGSVPWRHTLRFYGPGPWVDSLSGHWGNAGVLTQIDIAVEAQASGDDIDYKIEFSDPPFINWPLTCGHILTDVFTYGATQWKGTLPLKNIDVLQVTFAYTSGTAAAASFIFSGYCLEPIAVFDVN